MLSGEGKRVWTGLNVQEKVEREAAWNTSQRRIRQIVNVEKRAREKARIDAAPNKYFNPDWRDLREGDVVVSLIDPKVRGEITRIDKVSDRQFNARLKMHTKLFCLCTLAKAK